MFRRQLLKTITLFSLLLSQAALSLPNDNEQEIIITAQRATLNNLLGIVTYQGNVELTQGTLHMKADHLVLHRTADTQNIDKVIAKGKRAYYSQILNADEPRTEAYANTIEYQASTRNVYLQGNGELIQGQNRFAGEQLRYDLDTETLHADNGQTTLGKEPARIKMVIQPQAIPGKDNKNP